MLLHLHNAGYRIISLSNCCVAYNFSDNFDFYHTTRCKFTIRCTIKNHNSCAIIERLTLTHTKKPESQWYNDNWYVNGLQLREIWEHMTCQHPNEIAKSKIDKPQQIDLIIQTLPKYFLNWCKYKIHLWGFHILTCY